MSRVIDPALVRRAQAGDAQAVEQVLAESESLIRHLAYRKDSQEADTEDRLQEIRLQVWRKALPGWSEDKGTAFSSWAYWWARARRNVMHRHEQKESRITVGDHDWRDLYGIQACHRCGLHSTEINDTNKSCTRAIQQHGVEDYSVLEPAQILSDSLKSLSRRPDERIEQEKLQKHVRNAFNYLTPDERLILSLRFYEDRTVNEILAAAREGSVCFEDMPEVTIGRIRVLEDKALNKMGKVLGFFLKKVFTKRPKAKDSFRVVKVKKIKYVDDNGNVVGTRELSVADTGDKVEA